MKSKLPQQQQMQQLRGTQGKAVIIRSRDRTIVTVDNRLFTVAYGIDDVPLRITERKKVTNFGVDYEYNYPYWHRTHALGGPKTLPARILAAALEKRKQQD